MDFEQKLSPRLLALARFVPCGTLPADIGTDHAYLPIYLVTSGKCSRALAGDVHQGPFEAAKRAVQEFGLADRISIRKGDGLAVLRPGEANVAIIAGMGGGTIQGILEAEPEIANALAQLILQPMVDAGQLRGWLLNNGWQISAEELVEEEGRLYEIILCQQMPDSRELAGTAKLDPVILEIGPKLLEQKHPLLPKHLEKLIQDRQRVIAQISNSQSATAQAKSVRIQAELTQLQNLRDSLKNTENWSGI